jgi:CBS domain-containing protein
MNDHDCAAIPIVDSGRLVGLVTDRDIACRAVVRGGDAPTLPASSIMSPCVIAVGPDEPLEKAINLMEENVIHHLAVIGRDGSLIGMIAQSDVGRRLTNRELGELVRKTSIRDRHDDREIQAVVRRR